MARLPFVFINTATTADGKIAPANRHFIPFSSKRDQQFLLELRTRADAVLSGARTIDLTQVDLGPGGKKYQKKRLEKGLQEFNLRVIVSGSASVNPKAHIFTTRFSPILILTTEAAPKSRRERLASVVDDMFVSPGANLDFHAAFEWLQEKWKVKRLLCEGGGEVNASLFRARLFDELYLTICPVIFGGRHAPTLADGDGIERLEDAIRLKLKKFERIGDELYCVYRPVN
ncbi:MAG TPA: dihydrofolate reductase family protein [Verrucomicrobiae bacterium]|jgi:riboflavin-specific deaminase-like protein|nr:dihydrofolate reductase family protein [Verrucomicrobiae bacterium]